MFQNQFKAFDTPVYQNESMKHEDIKIYNKVTNYTANSNIFKKSQENDQKFHTDSNYNCKSIPNNQFFRTPSVLPLSTNSPMYYPNNIPVNPELNSYTPYDYTIDDNKYISIYDIQIENDDKFKVTKRVIGLKVRKEL